MAEALPPIPLMAPIRFLGETRDEILAAVERVIASGHWAYGSEGRALEKELAEFLEADRVVVTACGTDALWMCLQALGVGPGDEVITPAYSFFASASVIRHLGATPVFCDADERTYNLDADAVENAITSRTVGIVAVHLYGLPSDLKTLGEIASKYSIFLLEDACQAIGAKIDERRVGTFGDLSAFSFYPTKNLAACGEGGAVSGRDAKAIETVSRLRLHGETERYRHNLLGRNSRMDEIQSAIVRIGLKRLESWTARRQEIASRYTDAWADLPLRVPYVPDGFDHVYHLYVVRSRDRDRLREFLGAQGVATGLYYPVPLPSLEVFADLECEPGQFPVAESLSREVLAMPVYPQMTDKEIERVIEAVLAFHGW